MDWWRIVTEPMKCLTELDVGYASYEMMTELITEVMTQMMTDD